MSDPIASAIGGEHARQERAWDERKALEDCVGALQFILAFYNPGQRHLDTEAWKSACASGVAAYRKGATLLGWCQRPIAALNGEVHYDAYALSILKSQDLDASGTPTRRAETTGSVAEGDGGPAPARGRRPMTIGVKIAKQERE